MKTIISAKISEFVFLIKAINHHIVEELIPDFSKSKEFLNHPNKSKLDKNLKNSMELNPEHR
jgi:hypothetical protein